MRKFVVLLSLIFLSLPFDTKEAKSQDPGAILRQVIQALQTGGPQPAFQWFGQQLFMTVAQQTGGQGLYPPLQQLGPVTNLQMTGQQPTQAGPIMSFQVQHQNGASVWQMGISSFTNRIEYLNFNVVQRNQNPTPVPPPTHPVPGPTPPPQQQGDGCAQYPSMCAR